VAGLVRDAGKYVETAVEDETLVMLLDSGDFFSLTGTARAIWNLLDGTRDRPALIADLAQRFDASQETVTRDVDAFLAELAEAGLLKPN
jgi:pyrroloquinoline quinone biosynthesis protein D